MKGTLPGWLEPWFGLKSADAGEGTVWTLAHDWPWASWVTLVALSVVVAIVGYAYLREAGSARRGTRLALLSLRLLLVGILLFMLAQFSLTLERTGLPYLVVAVDDSASMQIVDHHDDEQIQRTAEGRVQRAGLPDATRLNLAKALLLEENAEFLRDVAERYKLRLYLLSDAARSEPGDLAEVIARVKQAQPNGQSTRLGQGVRAILNDLRGAPPTAIVLLSDGVNTEGEPLAEAAAYARRKGVPLYTVGLGNERPDRDLAISDLLVDEVVFVDDVVNFEFKLTAQGFAGQQGEVVLREKNDPAVLARTTVVLPADGEPQRVRLPYRPTKVGEFEYVVEVQPLAGEVQADNNRQQRAVSVRKEQIRVLLVQSYPSYEFRYLKHLLERDGTVRLQTLLQESDEGFAQIDPTAVRSFPVRREELFENDVLIFGDVNPAFLGPTALQNVADFVTEKGGGLVLIAGEQFMPLAFRGTPLEGLLPVELDGALGGAAIEGASAGFQVVPTELGLASPSMQLGDTPQESRHIWSQLPPLYWMFEAPRLKPAVRVLAAHPTRRGDEGQGYPLICLQYVGSGKVLFHAVDGTWRWRFRVGDVFFARYWVQTIRYLSRAKLLGKDRLAELTSDRREYRRGEPVRLRVRFLDERQAPAADDGVTVVVEQEGRKNERLQLRRGSSSRGVFEGTVADLSEGRYHAWVAAPAADTSAASVDFLVASAPGEFEHVQMDAAELQRASAQTKGRYFTLATADQLRRALPPGRQVPIEGLQPIVLWNQWPVLLAFVGLLIGEWLLRKRQGMV